MLSAVEELHLRGRVRLATRNGRANDCAQASGREGHRNGVRVLPRQKCRIEGLAGGMQQNAPVNRTKALKHAWNCSVQGGVVQCPKMLMMLNRPHWRKPSVRVGVRVEGARLARSWLRPLCTCPPRASTCPPRAPTCLLSVSRCLVPVPAGVAHCLPQSPSLRLLFVVCACAEASRRSLLHVHSSHPDSWHCTRAILGLLALGIPIRQSAALRRRHGCDPESGAWWSLDRPFDGPDMVTSLRRANRIACLGSEVGLGRRPRSRNQQPAKCVGRESMDVDQRQELLAVEQGARRRYWGLPWHWRCCGEPPYLSWRKSCRSRHSAVVRSCPEWCAPGFHPNPHLLRSRRADIRR